MRRIAKKNHGFSLLELMLSLVALGIVSFAALQRNVDQTEDNVAKSFGVSVSLYSNAVAAYIADEGTAVPAGTFTGFDWLKGPGCGGSAPKEYLPCDWTPRLPFNIALETEVIYATATPGDPCPDPVGHVCAETRLSVPSVNGQERLDLAAEMLHATQGATSAVRSTQQDFRMTDLGQVQVSTRGSQAPPSEYLRRDGVNNWAGPDPLNLGDHDFVAVGDIEASGNLEGSRFIDRDDPAFIVDPDSATTLNQFRGAGDFDAIGGGSLLGHAEFGAGADVESAASFNAPAEFQDKTTFTGGDTQFNAQVNSTGSAPAEFNEATSEDISDFNAELEIIGVGVVGGACNANQENLRFNSAGELLECVSAQWQYAGIETRKGTITYYSLDATRGYGEFHWAGDGINIPGYHHQCSAQSIESSNQAEGGGARVEVNSGQDSFGRHQWQYLAHAGVEDADDIPLVLQSGERTVICLSLGPEPVQPTVSTPTNTAPTGSISGCRTGYVGEPFVVTAAVSDPDDPIIYQWSTSGACSLAGAVENVASIQRNSSGFCTVRVRVTDYYNASRTISSSCQVRAIPPPEVQGVCSCTVNDCESGSYDSDPPEPAQPSTWDPVVDGPWDPLEEWTCEGRNGGADDSCTEGGSCGPVSGICSSTRPNNCIRGNAGSLNITRDPDRTIYQWTCRGIAGGSDDSCQIINIHPHQCLLPGSTVNAVCGTADNAAQGCSSGTYEDAPGAAWYCRGQCGGSDDVCGGANPNPPVDGVCGTTLNNCVEGARQTVSSTTWNCLGIAGGADALGCTAIENGVCDTSIGTCLSTASAIGTTNPWTCPGSNGGADATCVFGECDGANNTCVQGTPNNIIGSEEWLCEGNIAGNSDDARCVIAVCGDTQGTCDEGAASVNNNQWTCQGGAAGSTADDVDCYVGACGTADNVAQGCTAGDWEHVDDTATDVLWDCKGAVNTSTVDDIQCTLGLPICGPTQGACDQGAPSGNTNPWTCQGATTNVDCTIGVCHFNTLGHAGGCDEGVSSDPSGNPWTCQGSYHDPSITTDDDDCFIGVCGTADNAVQGCPVGIWADASDLTSPTVVRWKCEGSELGYGNTDDDVMCEQEDGACDTMPPIIPGDCDQGISSDPRGATNPWVCAGTGGGMDVDCLFSFCGTQDNVMDGCMPGAYQDVPGHTWECHGNARDINCHVGLCDYSGPGLCVSPSTPYGTGYEWTCEGANSSESADDVDCVKAQCNTTDGADNSLKGCKPGIWEHVDDPPGGISVWNCRGNHPDNNITLDDALNCQQVNPNGVCGYDFVGDCDAGTSVGAGNEWVCEGPDPNVSTDDSLPCKIGQCPTTSDANGSCLVGTTVPDPVPEGDNWMCKGNHPVAAFTGDDVTCEPIIDGACGLATNTCYAGTFSGIPDDRWKCLGINGGEDKICPGQEEQQNNGCGEQENTCLIQGTSYSTNSDRSYMNAQGCSVHAVMTIVDMADTPDLLKWRCQYGYSGSCPGGNAVSGGAAVFCEIPTTNTAICGATDYTCDVGNVYSQQPGPPPTWVCDRDDRFGGVPGVPCTGSVDAVCGTADNAVQGCTDGTWQDETGDGWTCLGDNGGADVSCGGDCMPRAGYGGFYQWVDMNNSLFFTIPSPPDSVLGYHPSGWGVGDRCLTEVNCIVAQGVWNQTILNNSMRCFMPDPWSQSWIDFVIDLIGMCPDPIPLGSLCVQRRNP